jgi:hypothetical protein
LISGREHYFNNNEEMFSALGLAASSAVIVRCKNEFTEEEMREFFKRYVNQDIMMPDWLPRRPLVCQTIADMEEEDLDQMFGVGQDELSFFDHFISVLCRRDARISASFKQPCHKTVAAEPRPGRAIHASRHRSPGGEGAECTGAQTAVALRKGQGMATTSTAAIPRRWLPPAVGYARLLKCSASWKSPPDDNRNYRELSTALAVR